MESYYDWMEIVYTAAWNVIVVGGRLNIQRYGMLLWLEGNCIHSCMDCYCGWWEVVYRGMEWYVGWREIVYTSV